MGETAPAADKPADKPKTVKATIAKRRSLVLGGEQHAAGAEVEVPTAEYRELVAAGFLVDPKAPEPKVSEGPAITRTT